MALKLYFHPLASFCHKALIALYEREVAFEPVVVDLMDPASRAAFQAVWPPAKFPVLRDEARGHTVAEATVIIEYLDTHVPGRTPFVPADPDVAWQVRLWDRYYDHYVHEPMQKIVVDRLRPEGQHDAFGVGQAKSELRAAYDHLERQIEGNTWAVGHTFGLADCAAAPALFYGNTVVPFAAEHRNLAAYLERLMARRSYLRVLREAKPYANFFPLEPKPRFPD